MSQTKQAACGAWASLITSDLIVAGSINLLDVLLDGSDVYWIEGRPQESGRYVLVRLGAGNRSVDVSPPPFYVRTRVHEYGGGAAAVSAGVVYFSHFADQRLYRQSPGESPIPLTPAPPNDDPDHGLRYADGQIDAVRKLWIGIREDHLDSSKEAKNTIVAVSTTDGGAGSILVSGNDFYASPRLSPDRQRLAWLTWNHPNMPWSGTELWIGDFDGTRVTNSRQVAGGPDISIFQPEWGPSGQLYFVSDVSGWWNLYRLEADGTSKNVCPKKAEFGQPQWNFGMSTYAFLSDKEVACTYTESGESKLARLDLKTGQLTPWTLPFTEFSAIRATDGRVVFRGGSPTIPASIVILDPIIGVPTTIRKATTVADNPDILEYLTVPRTVEFPTSGGKTAFGLYYPPKNPDYVPLGNELPPLVVKCHGGPTAAASSTLDLRTQYWTSRGIAVIDVDYGGSNGYGREYRNRLNSNWGVVDVDDCVAAGKYLSDQGLTDANRSVITGGSAGGYTTLACLTFRDFFRAGGSHYGVSDLAALAKDTHKFESHYLDSLIGPYPAAKGIYDARSPVQHADQVKVPVAFFQGSEDQIVPPNQTEVMVDALRSNGVAVEYMLFEGEQHGFRQAENIKRALDAELYFYSVLAFKNGLRFKQSKPVSPENEAKLKPVVSAGRRDHVASDGVNKHLHGAETVNSPTVTNLFDAQNGIVAVFFDLGDTLGTAVAAGSPPHLVNFHVFSYAPGILSNLRARGLKLGVISNTGTDNGQAVNAIIAPTGVLADMDPGLLVYSADEQPMPDGTPVTKRTPEIFRRAAQRAGLQATPERCLFVGEDTHEREVADSAGWKVCPDPSLVAEVLDGQPLQFVRLTTPATDVAGRWRDTLKREAFVPQLFAGPRGTTIYGVTSQRVAMKLIDLRLGVEFLGAPDLPLSADLYLLHDDVSTRSGYLSPQGETARTFADPEAARLIVGTTTEGVIAAFPPGAAEKLETLHFEGARHGHNLKLTPDMLLWETAAGTAPPAQFAARADVFSTASFAEFAGINGAEILSTVRRYSGSSPVDGDVAAPITSRHIRHPDNQRAVEQLVRDLEAAGGGRLQVRLQRFSHVGLELHNVEAELPGQSPELVLVTAHLDSTAAFHEPYDPAVDPAPGADDDASGIAAVLAIARRFATLAATTTITRTVRFVLFNAEEQGLVGSKAYARLSKSRGEAIAAVWQMDMIGFNQVAPKTWEVHAGFAPSPLVEARSRRLAELVRDVAAQVSPSLPTAEVYHSQTVPEGDPAAGRSDHAAFQAQGYPAVVVSENFFVGPGNDAPAPQENPNYHRPGDMFVDEQYAAEITRAVGAAAWASMSQDASFHETPFTSFSSLENTMPASREFDSRKFSATQPTAVFSAGLEVAARSSQKRTNTLTGSPLVVPATGPNEIDKSLIERALAFTRSQSGPLGFEAASQAEFVPDPVIPQTSAGAKVVNLQQTHRGLTVFQMTRSVRFSPIGQLVDAVGDTAVIPDDLDIEPKVSVRDAVLKGAQHLESTGSTEGVPDEFGQVSPPPSIELKDFKPQVLAGFPIPSQATVLNKGPFENPIPAHLLIFNQRDVARLGWYMIFTFPGDVDKYAVIVAADDPNSDVLFSKSLMTGVFARGRVFQSNPGEAASTLVNFPRPITDYPAMPTTPITAFPADWVEADKTIGNNCQATLNFGSTTLNGVLQGGTMVFDPVSSDGDEQKLLNIFYFCNYMHDFLYVLGFDEASGNFQQANLAHLGSGGDRVRARAHSGPVDGTANMSTSQDGLPPVMNMGLVVLRKDPSTGAVLEGRHTAFDSDVVFHEYTHGLTNRMVMGGRINAPHSLDKLQSQGMGEGWSDYYAMTIQNFFRTVEKTVTGDWVVKSPAGIRRAPYDDAFPFKYQHLVNSRMNRRTRRQDEHDIGEVWCATLLMMTRKLRLALGNDQQGYRLAWQMVTDGLKLTPPNPSFLDARDAILLALDHLLSVSRISFSIHIIARRCAWEAFAHFGMGVNASSTDADDVENIVADTTLPPGI
jgi:dipeptidyl aminopeptidase/acylaminoacyl peptidase